MNITETLVMAAQASATERPSLFPFPFMPHLIFCCLALIFFIFQFVREKKPYQLIIGFAIPFSLLIRLSDSRTLFYTVGIVEAVLFAAAIITAIIFKNKNKKAEAEEAAAEETVNEESTADDEAQEASAEAEESETEEKE